MACRTAAGAEKDFLLKDRAGNRCAPKTNDGAACRPIFEAEGLRIVRGGGAKTEPDAEPNGTGATDTGNPVSASTSDNEDRHATHTPRPGLGRVSFGLAGRHRRASVPRFFKKTVELPPVLSPILFFMACKPRGR